MPIKNFGRLNQGSFFTNPLIDGNPLSALNIAPVIISSFLNNESNISEFLQPKLSFDNIATSGSSNILTSGVIYSTLALKVNLADLATLIPASLSYDNVPVSGSNNILRSGGIFTALSSKANSTDLLGLATTTYVDTQISSVNSSITTLSNEKAPINNPTFTGTVSGITKAMIGLANVSNITPENYPLSTAQQSYVDTAISNISQSIGPSYTSLSEDTTTKKLVLDDTYSFNIGTGTSTNSVSVSPLSFTRSNVSFSSSQYKFATGSAYFPSLEDSRFVLTNVSSIASSLTGNFTVEGWFYPTQDASTSGNYQTVFCSNTADKTGFFIDFENTGGGKVIQAYLGEANSNNYRNTLIGSYVQGSVNGPINTGNDRVWNQNTWNHWALTYSTTLGYDLFLNGRLVAKDTSTIISSNWLNTWTIGCRYESNEFSLGINQGYLNHLRISNTIRYTTATRTLDETYTMPTAFFTWDSNTVYYNTLDQTSGFNLSLSQIGGVSTTSNVKLSSSESIFANSITLVDSNKNPTVRISENTIYFF